MFRMLELLRGALRPLASGVVIVAGLACTTYAAHADAPLRSDFDGDGFDDLVIAIPGRLVDGAEDAGAIVIVPGGPEGVAPAEATQIWHRGSDGMPGDPAAGERWGMVLAAADFNNDGFFDLAVGSPLASVDDQPNTGDVVILFGSRDGLRTLGVQHITPDDELGAAFFGTALATGAFNNDPFVDLAIGAPGANQGVGAVIIYQAAIIGPLARSTTLTPDMAVIDDESRQSQIQGFGAALAAGAFDQVGAGPGREDLAIATRQRDRGDTSGFGAGRIYIAQGGTAEETFGLTLTAAEFLDLDLDIAPALIANGSLYATTLLAGDFNGDGNDDLTIGAPTAGVLVDGTEQADGGAVPIIPGTPDGLDASNVLLLLQDTVGFRDDVEDGDFFGTAIAIGDFDDDGYDDFVVGTPLEDDYGLTDRGTMHVVYGAEEGLNTISRRMTVHHDLEYYGAEISQPDNGNMFGSSLGIGDFNGDGYHDIAIGIVGKPGGDGPVNDGWVLIMYGGLRGAVTTFADIIAHDDLTRLELEAAPNDYFGLALSGGTSSCGLGAFCMLLR